ncbi:sugar transferase [Sphingomonas koreensis]|nr:sugar transferase [Sphingomonas koreensis]
MNGATEASHQRDRSGLYRRIADIAVVIVAAPFAAIIMAAMAPVVLIGLGRPVLFRQQRSGRGGTVFALFKFRTMHDRTGADGTPLPDAQRTPAIGRLLRRSRLDELPELWNILRGDMSLIGPRPLLPDTIEALGDVGRHRGRVAPGLTGWAQTSGNAILTNADKLALDLWYIDHRTVWLDLLIVVRTIGLMIGGDRINHDRLARAKAGVAITARRADRER